MRTAFLFLALAVFLPAPLPAETPWGSRTSAGEWAFAQGDYNRAEQEFRAALEIAQDLPEGDVRLEESLRNLARVLEFQGRLDEAEPMYLLLLAAEEHRVGTDSPELMDTLAALARVALPSGDHPVALESLERFVALADAAGITDDDRLRTVLSALARVYLIVDRGPEALEAQRRSTEMTLANPGLDPPEQAEALESLAQLEIRFGDGAGVPALLDQAAALRRQENPATPVDRVYLDAARTALGENDAETAAAILDAFRRAEPDAGTTMELARLDADVAWAAVRRDSASVVDLMAVTEDPAKLERAAKALSLLDSLIEAEHGPDDPARLETLGRLARVAVMQGDLEKALEAQTTLTDILGSTAGPAAQPTRTALRAVIDLLLALHRNAEAADANARLIEALDQAWGPDDPRLLPSLRLQYDLLKDAHRKKEARAIKKRIKKLQ